MHCRRPIVLACALTALAVPALHAQRADLRYVAPMPSRIVFTAVDSVSATLGGMPTGDMRTSGHTRSVNELRFTPTADGFEVTGTLRELGGTMSTPMGEMPVEMPGMEPVSFTIDAQGPSPDMGPGMQIGSAPDAMGSAKAVAGLLRLPGRVLNRGETWRDSVHTSPNMEGIAEGVAGDVVVVTRGTYERDTIVDDVRLNILRVDVDLTVETAGDVQGLSMKQSIRITSEGLVLWDSARHMPVFQDMVSETRGETTILQPMMVMTMTGRNRSIVTAAPGS